VDDVADVIDVAYEPQRSSRADDELEGPTGEAWGFWNLRDDPAFQKPVKAMTNGHPVP
jgi:hypothetical protein